MQSSLMITFQRVTPRSWRKSSLSYKTGEFGRRFTAHRGRKEFTSFTKVNAPGKEGSGTYSQEEIDCIKFSQVEGDGKAALVSMREGREREWME